MGVVVGLVVGKTVGIVGGAYLVARFTRAALAPGLGWSDVFGVALVSGIGFTVSLLVTELAFAGDPDRQEYVRAAVLAGSLLAALLAAGVLRARHRAHEALADEGEDDPT